MVFSGASPTSGLSLTFRVAMGATLAAVFTALVVGAVQEDQLHREAERRVRTQAATFAQDLANRAAVSLEREDALRLAVLAATAEDLTGQRIQFLSASGDVLVDTGLVDGGSRLALKAASEVVQWQADGRMFTAAAASNGVRRVGEVRLEQSDVVPLEASGGWPFGGLMFLASLGSVMVASLLVHQWASRMRQAAGVVRGIASGRLGIVDGETARNAPGEIGDLYASLQELDRANARGGDAVGRSLVAMATQMVDALERKGAVQPGHGERTSGYAMRIAGRLDLLEADRRDLDQAARLHSLGKMWVRGSILSKKEALTAVERDSLRQYPVRGAECFSGLPGLERVASIIRHHQEKYDGTGYPDGLRGDRIPLAARILAIANAYEQFTTGAWPGGQALSWSDALDRMHEDRGEVFDPWLFDLFEGEMRKTPEPPQQGQSVVVPGSARSPYRVTEEEVVPEPEAVLDEVDDDEIQVLSDKELELMYDESPDEENRR